jgi:hypothetical protein
MMITSKCGYSPTAKPQSPRVLTPVAFGRDYTIQIARTRRVDPKFIEGLPEILRQNGLHHYASGAPLQRLQQQLEQFEDSSMGRGSAFSLKSDQGLLFITAAHCVGHSRSSLTLPVQPKTASKTNPAEATASVRFVSLEDLIDTPYRKPLSVPLILDPSSRIYARKLTPQKRPDAEEIPLQLLAQNDAIDLAVLKSTTNSNPFHSTQGYSLAPLGKSFSEQPVTTKLLRKGFLTPPTARATRGQLKKEERVLLLDLITGRETNYHCCDATLRTKPGDSGSAVVLSAGPNGNQVVGCSTRSDLKNTSILVGHRTLHRFLRDLGFTGF